MAHKTFISYKYSEACPVRNKIISALGSNATYYRGEDGFSDDLSSYKAETIKNHLKDMLFDTSVTIVVISPYMKQSEWIDWEIEYSLREYERDGTTSHTNGVVGVVMKYNDGYDWIRTKHNHSDGHTSTSYSDSYLFDIIKNNRFNQTPKVYACEQCKTVNSLTGCYISLVDEEGFLADPNKYIENAYEKSQNLGNYEICKSR